MLLHIKYQDFLHVVIQKNVKCKDCNPLGSRAIISINLVKVYLQMIIYTKYKKALDPEVSDKKSFAYVFHK